MIEKNICWGDILMRILVYLSNNKTRMRNKICGLNKTDISMFY